MECGPFSVIHRYFMLALAGTLLFTIGCTNAIPAVETTLASTSFQLTSPTTGTKLKGGTSMNITWSSNATTSANPITIEYTVDGGSSWNVIASGIADSGSYFWFVPSIDVSGIQMRITAVEGVDTFQDIETSIEIDSTPPTIGISSPSGGEFIDGGSTYSVNYTAATDVNLDKVKLELSNDSGSTWSVVNSSLDNSGTYSWSVPSVNKSTMRFKLTANDVVGNTASVEAGDFGVDSADPTVAVTKPLMNELIASGSTYSVQWTASDALFGATPIKIEFTQDDGATWFTLASAVSNSGTYSWNVPAIDTADARIRVTASDQVPHSVADLSDKFIIDGAAPLVTIGAPLGGEFLKGGSTFAITWTASDANFDANPISIEYSQDGGFTWLTIVAATDNDGSYTWTVPSLDISTARVRVTATDKASRATYSESADFTIDSTMPLVDLTSPDGGELFKNGDTVTINWTATDTNLAASPIDLDYSSNGGGTWTNIISATSNSGSYNWTPPVLNGSQVRVRARVTDQVGQSATDSSAANFTVDHIAPTISAFELDSGAASTSDAFVTVNLTAGDSLTNVTHFCLKNAFSVPVLADNCWHAVAASPPGLTPALTLSMSGYYHNVGFSAGAKTVYVWTRDAAGNISSFLSDGITKVTNPAPTVRDILVANTSAHSDPPTTTERTVPIGTDVIIKWNAIDDLFGANPIAVYYTTDDSNFTLIGSNFVNGANNSCAYDHAAPASDNSMTGCLRWTNTVTSSYMRFKVIATDAAGQTHSAISQAINTSKSLIVGKLDSGIGNDARKLLISLDLKDEFEGDPDSFVMKANGDVYIRDPGKGLIYISAMTGIAQLLIPTTGTVFGNGVAASSATMRMPIKITLDKDENLLIFDYDRIRKLNTSTHFISNFIGGGISTADNTPPNSFQISPVGQWGDWGYKYIPFTALPNGDLYFRSSFYYPMYTQAEGARIKYYDSVNNVIKTFSYSGLGTSNSATQDSTVCNLKSFGLEYDSADSSILTRLVLTTYDSANCATNYGASKVDALGNTTPVHPVNPYVPDYYGFSFKTGRDGSLYMFSRGYGFVMKYNRVSSSWSTVAGIGVRGYCADGTLASVCPLEIQDIFVSSSGQLFLLDNNLVRAVEADGKLTTVYGTRIADVEENVLGTSTYIGKVENIQRLSSGGFIFLDHETVRFRELNSSYNVTTIAGNGTLSSRSTAVAATTTGIGYSFKYNPMFAVNPLNGDVFYNEDNIVYRLNRATGKWVHAIGGGGNYYATADGLAGNLIDFPYSYIPRVVGFDGVNLMVANSHYDYINYNPIDAMLKMYDSSTGYSQSLFAGVMGPGSTVFCADTTLRSSCAVPYTGGDHFGQPQYIGGFGWYILAPGSARIVFLPSADSAISTLTTLPGLASSFAYDPVLNRVFACSVTGSLYVKSIGSGTTTAIPLTYGAKCRGTGMIYDGTSLFLPVTADGYAYGIMKIENP